ncbi:MAG: glycosyltransferase family 2 protein [Anaerolineaceae bacterium]|nr:glycosyltransferase family 2 protein [Anaerolineaceae bacterium]
MIPAYNEEKHLGQVIQVANFFLPVIVVDDGSVDNTEQISREAGAIVFKQIPNQGKGAALQRGFQECLALGFDFVITLDADGQHNPNEITNFIDSYFTEKKDLIIGYRDFSKMPFVRRLANTIGGWLFTWAIQIPIKDNQSGYRLISKDLITKILEPRDMLLTVR